MNESRRKRIYRYGAAVVSILDKTKHCVLCNKVGKLVPDHDHKTGQFRGVLCYGCNLGLGLLKDDTDLLARAIVYLQKDQKCSVFS